VRNLASRNLTTAGELREWLENRKLGPKRLDLNRFISFALSVDGPPKFNYKFASHEMPPDVVPLAGFERLISRFYAEAQVEELYKQAQPAIERVLASYQPAVVQTLGQVNGYLRNPTSGYAGRRFSIIVELLGPPNQIQTRAYRDDYYLILTPSPELQTDYIRYAYLQYLLDPLSFKFAAKLEKKKPLIDLAQAAPALEEHYKADFSLLTTASLIRAIEARIDRRKSPDQALREGFILTPYFTEALAKYEAQEASLRLYYPEMIDAIDLKKEDKRLAAVDFLKDRPVKTVTVVAKTGVAKEEKVELTGVFKTLEEAETLYRAAKLEPSRDLFLRALQETADQPLHAKAYYGLGRVAARQANLELAEKMFTKVLELSPDPQTKAWTHVYLGNLAERAQEPQQATAQFEAALAVPGATAAARQAAQQALNKLANTPKEKE
jgi:tetratricopeptide (TPR) repeat protein